MNLKTSAQIIDFIDGDFIWRKRELTQYKFLLESSKNKAERSSALLRGAVTLLYAHWEGFVKAVGLAYLEYVANQALRFDELSLNFLALASRRMINSSAGVKNIKTHIDLVSFLSKNLNQKSVIPYKDGISTKSNLSSEVLRDITDTLGLDFSPFESKANLIDESLLASRNTIAHGEYIIINGERYEEVSKSILSMMEEYRTQIQNAVVLKSFRA